MSTTAARQAARLARRVAAIDARGSMSPQSPAEDRLRIATWNVNSLKARSAAFERFLERTAPDIVCVQETKATDLAPTVVAALDRLGYRSAHIGKGGYNGVAVIARHPITEVRAAGSFGDEHLDREPRLISCLVHAGEPIRIASVYVPHGREIGHWHFEYKLAFLDALTALTRQWLAEGPFVIGGDVNVAPTDSDVFHPDAFVGITHVTPEERAALTRLLATGLVDLDAIAWGADARRFTWWNHGRSYPTNLGMRIDLLAADERTAGALDTTWIDHVERGAERPSDHAALIADLDPRRR